tara:strand:+ start:7546 stop:7974 length:429 start_codon:yes stop_codon:yes gene_type:complete
MSLKSKLDDLIEELLDETNSTGEGEAYDTPNAFGELEDEDIEKSGYKKVKESTFKKAAKLMIGEGSYKSYKNDESFTPKQKVNKAIKSINSKLYEIDRVLTHNIKLKNETGVDSTKYWKATRTTLYRISEKMQKISEKLRKF